MTYTLEMLPGLGRQHHDIDSSPSFRAPAVNVDVGKQCSINPKNWLLECIASSLIPPFFLAPAENIGLGKCNTIQLII